MDCFEDKASVETPCEGAEVARQMFGGDHSVGGEQLFLILASMVFAQRKAGWRAALRSEPVTWRSWTIPGCSAMQRNQPGRRR